MKSQRFCALSIPVFSVLFLVGGCQTNPLTERGQVGERPQPLEKHIVIESQLNDFTASAQSNVALDVAPGGNIVAVWDSRRQQVGSYGIYARLLNARGEALSPEVRVNEFTRGHQTSPSVAVADDGTVWMTWVTNMHAEHAGAVVARRFDAQLLPLTDEFIVNQEPISAQTRPAVETDAQGRALITWTGLRENSSQTRIAVRAFGADGAAASNEFTIGGRFEGFDSLPAVARTGDDAFMITWARRRADVTSGVNPYMILAQRIDSMGAPLSDAFAVNDFDGRIHIEPAIDGDAHGNAVIAWHVQDPSGNGEVMMRRVHADNTRSRAKSITTLGGWISGVAVAVADDGRALISHNRQHDDGNLSVIGRLFDSTGGALGEPFIINRHTSGNQFMQMASNARRVVWSGDDVIAVGWHGDAGLGDDSAANVTLLTPPDLTVPAPDQTRLAMAGAAESAMTPIPPIRQRKMKLPPIGEPDGVGPDFGFLGINYTGWTPPDPEIAAGPEHLVAMTNGAIAFFDKQGTLLFQDEIEDSFGFWGSVGATNFVFDPECLYDRHSNRFFAMACERASNGRSYYLLAVSDDSNPIGTWHKYRILRTVDNDIDSPNMAVDDTVVYLSADFFGPDKYEVTMIEKDPLLSGGAINSTSVLFTGSGNQSMGIPIIYDTNQPAGYIIQSSEGTGNGLTFSEVRFHAIQNQLTSPTVTSIDVTVPTYSYPNQPPQAGTSNRPFLFEPRFWSTMYINGSFWAVHHVNSNRARARWYEFEMNGWPDSGQTPTLRQWGEIDPDPTTDVHTYFPSIAADAQGNAVIFFSRSSPSEFISIGRAFRRHDDPLGEFRPMEFVKESTVPYIGANRWGDYSHVEEDPAAPETFWGHHEWTDTSTAWRTWIAQVDTRPPLADVIGFEVTHGSLLGGGVEDLEQSDDNEVSARSAFGFSATEANLLRFIIDFHSPDPDPASLQVTVESRLNNPGGTAKLWLFRWPANEFRLRDEWAIGLNEIVNVTPISNATPFVNGSGDIRMQLQYTVIATFSAEGFDAFVDQTKIELQ